MLKQKIKYVKNEHLLFLLLFVTLSYYLNATYTSVYRFIISTSALYGIILFISVMNFVPKDKYKRGYLFLLGIIIFAYFNSTYNAKYTIRNPFTEKYKQLYIYEKDLKIEDNAKVILVDYGTSFFIEGQNKNAKYYGFVIPENLYEKYKSEIGYGSDPYFINRVWFSKYLENILKDIFRNKNEKIYVVINFKEYSKAYIKFLNYYSNNTRKLENCKDAGIYGIINSVDPSEKVSIMFCEYNLKK